MSNPPLVSIVMGVYNAERTLPRAVDSLLQQSFQDFELIVIDDGSTDGGAAWLLDCQRQDARLRVVRQDNQGLTAALIHGASLARGAYLARQDADDISLPDRLQKQLAVIQARSSCVLVASWVEDQTVTGQTVAVHRASRHSIQFNGGGSREFTAIAAHGSVLMRKQAFDAVGGYRRCFYYAQDSDLWLRLSAQGEFVVIPEVLYRRTIGEGSISARYTSLQAKFCGFAQASYWARTHGESDDPVCRQANVLADQCRAARGRRPTRNEQAAAKYLTAIQVMDHQPNVALSYLRQAIRLCPWHVRSWRTLVLLWGRTRRRRDLIT